MFAIIGLSVNAQWVQTSLDSTDVNCIVISENNIFAGTGSSGSFTGVYLSSNNGSSWVALNTGINN